ncbi:hypothetical protein C7416_104478 [Cupriavidus phytorum]|uniref:SET domain-containing protein n=1 Tax=Cupriavidus phytorum TaxID=3024399 RepID=A0A2W7P1S7_9BURK|nr:hypothetical protein [Cupriavidus alkaliphilus]PZX29473.1 hypothetical protein C7416_104478 [Cupriavidus alkaliphilus]
MSGIQRVTPKVTFSLASAKKVDLLEREFLKLPQVDCPVVHRFGPGIYIREVTVPAGAYAIGHAQRFEHLNVFLKGRVIVINEDGSRSELVAPMTFVGKPGRKVGYVVEDMVWQNVYATTETDVAKLEAMFLDKSDGWKAHAAANAVPLLPFESDRSDYASVLTEFGFTEEVARAQAENEADQTPFPLGSYKVAVAPSPIEGKGLFATAAIDAGEVIAPARIGGKRTPAGRYTNHSAAPNAVMVMREGGDIDLVALRQIKGCAGGQFGEEITINYRDALRLQIKKD